MFQQDLRDPANHYLHPTKKLILKHKSSLPRQKSFLNSRNTDKLFYYMLIIHLSILYAPAQTQTVIYTYELFGNSNSPQHVFWLGEETGEPRGNPTTTQGERLCLWRWGLKHWHWGEPLRTEANYDNNESKFCKYHPPVIIYRHNVFS